MNLVGRSGDRHHWHGQLATWYLAAADRAIRVWSLSWSLHCHDMDCHVGVGGPEQGKASAVWGPCWGGPSGLPVHLVVSTSLTPKLRPPVVVGPLAVDGQLCWSCHALGASCYVDDSRFSTGYMFLTSCSHSPTPEHFAARVMSRVGSFCTMCKCWLLSIHLPFGLNTRETHLRCDI